MSSRGIRLLKPPRPAKGTLDFQVSYIMSGDHFDILVGCVQCHLMISVEVTVFLSVLTGMLKGVYLLGSGSVLSGL